MRERRSWSVGSSLVASRSNRSTSSSMTGVRDAGRSCPGRPRAMHRRSTPAEVRLDRISQSAWRRDGRRRNPGLGPQLGGEGVAEARPRPEREERHQGLGVATADPDGDVAGEDVEPTKKADRERVSSAHQTPIRCDGCARRSPQEAGRCRRADRRSPQGPAVRSPPGRATPRPSPSVVFPPDTPPMRRCSSQLRPPR